MKISIVRTSTHRCVDTIMISNTNIRSMNYLNITRQSVSCIVLQSELSTKNKMIYIKSNPEYDHRPGHALFLTTKLEAPSEGEEVDELGDAEEAEPGAEPHQAPEGGDEVLHGVDHVLVELDDALVVLFVAVPQLVLYGCGKGLPAAAFSNVHLYF